MNYLLNLIIGENFMNKNDYIKFAQEIQNMCERRVAKYKDNACNNCPLSIHYVYGNSKSERIECSVYNSFPDTWKAYKL